VVIEMNETLKQISKNEIPHFVIVCTLNRHESFNVLVNNLQNQTYKEFYLVVVDASDAEISNLNLDSLKGSKLFNQFHLINSVKNLTTQRNIALDFVRNQVDDALISFLDDDIIIPTGYLSKVRNILLNDYGLAGAGGVPNFENHKISILKTLIFMGRKSGRLTPSGINIGFNDESPVSNCDWLPGCTMSYRLKSIESLRFDENRLGVGWGEDVDFSARARSNGDLIAFRQDFIVHCKSPINRDSKLNQIVFNDYSRLKLAKDKVLRVRTISVIITTACELSIEALYIIMKFTAKLISLFPAIIKKNQIRTLLNYKRFKEREIKFLHSQPLYFEFKNLYTDFSCLKVRCINFFKSYFRLFSNGKSKL
jgi:GT2 family glycosyltransferase